MLTSEEVAKLFKLAKGVISNYLKNVNHIEHPSTLSEGLRDKRFGVFITLRRIDDASSKREIVSCCGIPLPTKPILETVTDVAVSSAVRARLLSSVKTEEINTLEVEMNIITQLEPIHVDNPLRYIQEIKIGEDGLMVERGIFKGVLLPWIPVDNGWDAIEFLSECCIKAGLQPDSWLEKDVKIFKFKTLTLRGDMADYSEKPTLFS